MAGSIVAVVASTLIVGGSMVAFADNSKGNLGFSSSDTTAITGPYNDGQVVYITMENSGGKDGNANYKSIPQKLSFSFTENGHSRSVKGQWVRGSDTNPSLVYKVTIPNDFVDGEYTVSTQLAMSPGSGGADTFSWSGTTHCKPIPAGQLPEFPYAGLAPVALLGAIGIGVVVRRRKSRTSAQ